MIRSLFIIVVLMLLSACNSATKETRSTLSDFVIQEENIVKNKKIEVSSEDAEKSYKSYLSSEGVNNETRKNALQRLAEIQLDITISKPIDSKSGYTKNSIRIFSKRLKDYPKDKNNDRVYYQLANAYAITGDESGKVSTLEKLTDTYPESKYYIESMFRLGESYIAKSQFVDAELALTSVIAEDESNKFRKNALFKRAWSRYKQLQYEDAINDYNQLLSFYPSGSSSNRADQEFLNNIYKVYGVCISYLGITDTLSSLSDSIKSDDTRFYIYSNLSKLLSKQDRYLDAATVLDTYLKNENNSHANKVISSLSDIWNKYENREFAMDKLLSLELTSGEKSKELGLNVSTIDVLTNNLVLVSEFYHSIYQKGNKENKNIYLNNAIKAYSRLINNYKYKKIDKYHYLYAELLNESKSFTEAISIYKQVVSRYKGSSYRNKSAFSLLVLTNKLFKKNKISRQEYAKLNNDYLKYLSVNKAYGPLLAYSEYLYNNSQYLQAVALIEEVEVSKKKDLSKLKYILAASYFEIKEYALSEENYRLIKKMKGRHKNVDKRLALSIFKQADTYKDKLLFDLAIKKYDEIYKNRLDTETIMLSKLEMSGLYMRIGKWSDAEQELNFIRNTYKKSKFSNDITRMLSIVYLNSNKYKLAAAEFESIHSFGTSQQLKKSALWQSAELYEKGGDYWSSVRTYKQYIKRYKQPTSLSVEAQHKLTEVYAKLNLNNKRQYWLNQIIKTTDKRGRKSTERMQYLASNASITLARAEYKRFSSIKLTIPLKVSLRKKKKVLKSAIASLKNVNKYKRYDHISESIYWIAETYYNFSDNLIKSDRPKNLSETELEQYNILLEDQSIPFEDQAIRYFIQNTKSTDNETFSEWKNKSFEKLSAIYPTKYLRAEKLDTQVNTFF